MLEVGGAAEEQLGGPQPLRPPARRAQISQRANQHGRAWRTRPMARNFNHPPAWKPLDGCTEAASEVPRASSALLRIWPQANARARTRPAAASQPQPASPLLNCPSSSVRRRRVAERGCPSRQAANTQPIRLPDGAPLRPSQIDDGADGLSGVSDRRLLMLPLPLSYRLLLGSRRTGRCYSG